MSENGNPDDRRPQVPPRTPNQPRVARPNDLCQGDSKNVNPPPPPLDGHSCSPPQGDKNCGTGPSFADAPVQNPVGGGLEPQSVVVYCTPLARTTGKGVSDSLPPPYIEDGEIVVPKEGGRQNAYHNVEIVPIMTESPTAQGFLKYLKLWADLKAVSTKEKVKPIIDLLKTKGANYWPFVYTVLKLFRNVEREKGKVVFEEEEIAFGVSSTGVPVIYVRIPGLDLGPS
ncbi:hypothetical protein TREMEDRAFT_62584 [Tremella mesenterica DSM 1558]|uniref:uncharacterized protein n=1 Tax=Tremella mesenterica (strain ATCC 24925 / CBS 8224 / DSM 1558 / NBRC 9311 / NRRL Y-6157 / RJB 2259-6 / UBC 559-6) TaxID=578456 RepID=UPI0003F49E5B|nr:uncharacterized protein TREMEDRAFT_62584 [Tremella mesenterica DSM 1558]EIW68857.1 hypothetical protein TREMEDRAFT_62584 [Tremella mesenterica DSM 1558]